MTDTIASQSAGSPPSRGVLARAFGIVFSPRATYAEVAAHPRTIGALLTVIAISGAATFWFLSTEVGQRAAQDQRLAAMESFGLHPSPEQLQRIEQQTANGRYFAIVAQAVVIPLISLIVAGFGLAVFTAALGGDGTFKQAYAVVMHSWFIPALASILVLPLNYLNGSLDSPTSLAVFAPMFEPAGFLGRLLRAVDLLRIWWLVSLAIGFGVLYKRRTGPIATVTLALYLGIAVIVAAVMTTLSGA